MLLENYPPNSRVRQRSLGGGSGNTIKIKEQHVASLLMIPNLNVFRPADGVEAAQAWAVLHDPATDPSLIAATRQNAAPVRETPTEKS